MIDPQAIIHPDAKIGNQVSIGPFTYIGPKVEIGERTCIGSHVVIRKNTKIGCDNKIADFASIGGDPQDITPQDRETFLEIGNNNIIREFCTLNRGSNKGSGITRIGSHNMLMAYIHVAHDCILGNHIIFANNASIAGHVTIEDYAILGAFAAVHQFCHVGAYSFLGRAAKVYQDILPYMLITGNPATPTGLNLVGLKRHGFNKSVLRTLKRIYQLFHRRDLKLIEIHQQLTIMINECNEVQRFLNIMDTSIRGIARPRLRRINSIPAQ